MLACAPAPSPSSPAGRPNTAPALATAVATLQPAPAVLGTVPPAIQTGVAQFPTVAASQPTPRPVVVATNPAIPAEAVVPAIAISQPTGDPNNPIQLAVPFPDVPRLTAEDVKQLKEGGAPVVVADVRSQPEYDQGHIPDAIMLPSGQATGPVTQFPKEVAIVLYCT